jgi:hypothetical protein
MSPSIAAESKHISELGNINFNLHLPVANQMNYFAERNNDECVGLSR